MLIIVTLSTDILEPEESTLKETRLISLRSLRPLRPLKKPMQNPPSDQQCTNLQSSRPLTNPPSRDQHPIQLSKQTRHWHFRSWRIPARGESESLVTAADSAITSRGGAWMQPTGNALFVLR